MGENYQVAVQVASAPLSDTAALAPDPVQSPDQTTVGAPAGASDASATFAPSENV